MILALEQTNKKSHLNNQATHYCTAVVQDPDWSSDLGSCFLDPKRTGILVRSCVFGPRECFMHLNCWASLTAFG